MATVGKISINLTAGTAQFNADMDKASAKIREFGSHGVSSVQATSAALRTLEGGVTNNLRAAERFLATTLGLGNALKAAFPVFGALALGGVLFELVSKAGAAYQSLVKLQEAPKRIGQEFQGIVQPIRVANDELAVSNDRLANEIAKLQGKPQNGLKLALDEAKLSADKLAEALNRDLQEVQKLLEQEQIGSFKGFFTHNAATSDLTEQFKQFREKLTDISLETGEKLAKTTDPKRQTALYEEATNRRKAAIEGETSLLKQQLAVAERIQASRESRKNVLSSTPYGPSIQSSGASASDQGARISELKGAIDILQQLSLRVSLTKQNEALTTLKGGLGTDKESKEDPVANKLAELRAEHDALTRQLQTAGLEDPVALAMAKGAGEASKAISELESHRHKLSLSQIADITAAATSNELTRVEIELRDKQAKVYDELKEKAEQLALTISDDEQKRTEQIQTISDQIDAARALAKAETQGADAVFAAQEKIKLAKIKEPDIRANTQTLDEVEHADQIAKTVEEINRQTDATKRLTAAANEGLAAQRQAAIANIQASGASAAEIKARVSALEAQYQLEDAQTLRTASAAEGARRYFSEMVDNARSAGQQIHDALAQGFEGLNDQLSRLLTGQKTSFGAFLQSLGQEIEKSALKNAEATIAEKIGVALSGKGKSRGVFDEQLPDGVSISKDGKGGVLGTLGGIFGNKAGTKRDGSSASRALFVQIATPGGDLLPAGTPSDQTGAGEGSKNSGLGTLGGIFGQIGKSGNNEDGGGSSDGGGGTGSAIADFISTLFGGFRAEGGDVDPGHAYMVGEQGPEIWTPPSRGNIIPNNKLGGAVYYNIDARGTDPVLTEQRTRAAIIAAHQSAVVTSAQVQSESAKRKPQK